MALTAPRRNGNRAVGVKIWEEEVNQGRDCWAVRQANLLMNDQSSPAAVPGIYAKRSTRQG